jgi:hypothetical protein
MSREEKGEAVRRGDPGLKDKIAIQGPTLSSALRAFTR